jgi:hypothetical protein
MSGPLRRFEVIVSHGPSEPSTLTLTEVNGVPPRHADVATIPADAGALVSCVARALTEAGYPRNAMVATSTPLVLSEFSGIRLSVTLLATTTTDTPERVVAVAGTVAGMAIEECVYWYAKCLSRHHGPQARRALREFVAIEEVAS